MTKIYHYDGFGFFTHEAEANLDPIGNNPIVPAYATLIAPPAALTHKIAKWNETKQQWTQVDDYRGRRYWTPTEGMVEISNAGVSPPAGADELAAGQTLIKDGETWRLRMRADDLADTKKTKIAELKFECTKNILRGFSSSALGSAHTYDSEQHNIDWIQAAVLAAADTQITCDDGKGATASKQPRKHTPVQCKTLLADGMAALLAHKTRFRALRDQVNKAADTAAVAAIGW